MPVVKLWQRIFLYSLMLVVLSIGMSVALHRFTFDDRRAGFGTMLSGELRRSLDGQSLRTAATILGVFNKHVNKFWLEDANGTFAAGERFDEKSGTDWTLEIRDPLHRDGVTLWRTGLEKPLFIITGPVVLDGSPYSLYHAFVGPPPPLRALFINWFIMTAIIGGVLSFWMARRVSRPLRRLEAELSELRRANNLGSVTVSGSDEIAAVATAVNQLTASLRKHITGMRELIINISHELRSPLARMALSADMIKQGLMLHPLPRGKADMSDGELKREATMLLAKKHFAALEEEIAHMENVIGSTLLSSKLDFQSPESIADRINLSRVCLVAVTRFEPLLQQQGLAFAYDIAPDLYVTGDETLLMQLLSNLLDNACKYTARPDGNVAMTLIRKNGHAFLTLENSFENVCADALERMFEPFNRLEQRTGTGVGLGLSLVRKIAALHKGDVMAVSTDTGICVCVQLPLTKNEPSYEDAPVQ